jgi:uncharacterized protein (TIGR02145 family)
MQAMTNNICSNSNIGDTNTLIDTRDDNTYNVSKLADGQCWMTQNLRIINKTITMADSDMNYASFTIPNTNWSTTSDKYTQPSVYNTNNTNYGVYYNYAAATAGEIRAPRKNNTVQTSSYSICPRGWRIPGTRDYSALTDAYGIRQGQSLDSVEAMQEAPLYYMLSGFIENRTTTSPSYQGVSAWQWGRDGKESVGTLGVSKRTDNIFVGVGMFSRDYGLTIRCMAR